MVHSVILYWMPMFAYYGDIIWSNGRDGGYLVLGNMVYTVKALHHVKAKRETNDGLFSTWL